ncbi:MAG: DUF835 domain-containing protein [Thermoplasmata archaeon]|nr:DUF835 domain-containing protein [Thermoplasmata archaeon]
MTEPAPEPSSASSAGDAAPPDEQYADAYSEGYGEGLREAFREVLSHVGRGHTVGEIRVLVESRLARIREDVSGKRRNLLGPPRRPAWGALLRPPATNRPEPETMPRLARGGSYLFREDRPRHALAFVGRSGGEYARILCVTTNPPEFAGVPRSRVEVLRLALPSPGLGASEGELDPSGLGGRIKEATEALGGVLVYLDAVEVMSTEYSLDTTLKFVNFVTAQVARTGSAFVASVDPGTLEERDLRRLQRSFNIVS